MTLNTQIIQPLIWLFYLRPGPSSGLFSDVAERSNSLLRLFPVCPIPIQALSTRRKPEPTLQALLLVVNLPCSNMVVRTANSISLLISSSSPSPLPLVAFRYHQIRAFQYMQFSRFSICKPLVFGCHNIKGGRSRSYSAQSFVDTVLEEFEALRRRRTVRASNKYISSLISLWISICRQLSVFWYDAYRVVTCLANCCHICFTCLLLLSPIIDDIFFFLLKTYRLAKSFCALIHSSDCARSMSHTMPFSKCTDNDSIKDNK